MRPRRVGAVRCRMVLIRCVVPAKLASVEDRVYLTSIVYVQLVRESIVMCFDDPVRPQPPVIQFRVI